LRKSDQRVEIGLVPQTLVEAKASQKTKGYSKLVYVE